MDSEQLRVLVADDEEHVREPLAKYLRQIHGFFVDTATDANQTLHLLEKNDGAYDVVVLDDLFLSDLGGSLEPLAVNLTKQIRTSYPNVQVIILSGWEITSAVETLRAGAYRFLSKPFNPKELALLIQTAVEHKKLDGVADEAANGRQISGASALIKILFLAANPLGSTRLRLDEEIRAIDLALLQSKFRDRFDLRQHWAVRTLDLQSILLRHRPDIVHFSGHGSDLSEIILEDSYGNRQPVSVRALKQLLSVLKDNVRCVILNACYSEAQAQAIAEYVDCVIGMSKAISDSAAISFAAAFYQALGYGRDVQTAFDLGCVQVDLENLDEQDAPRLLAEKTDPKRIVFVDTPA